VAKREVLGDGRQLAAYEAAEKKTRRGDVVVETVFLVVIRIRAARRHRRREPLMAMAAQARLIPRSGTRRWSPARLASVSRKPTTETPPGERRQRGDRAAYDAELFGMVSERLNESASAAVALHPGSCGAARPSRMSPRSFACT